MENKLLQKVDEQIEAILKAGINVSNLDHLYKLTKIKCMTKEEENMNYGNYNGRGPGHGSYGEYGRGSYGENYGRRGYDMKYRGDDHLERLSGDYGRYMDYRGRYGHNEDTDKSFHYMVKSLEDFVKYLFEEADAPQEKQMLREALEKSMR